MGLRPAGSTSSAGRSNGGMNPPAPSSGARRGPTPLWLRLATTPFYRAAVSARQFSNLNDRRTEHFVADGVALAHDVHDHAVLLGIGHGNDPDGVVVNR